MRTVLLSRVSVSSLLVVAALIVLWLALLPTGTAKSLDSPLGALQPTLTQTPSSPITDTRWLALIRSIAPSLPRSQATTALPSINVHLTDGLVAGRVPLASSVIISVTRDGSPLVSARATPFPDSDGFMYVAYLSWYGISGGGGGYDYSLQPGDVIWVRQANALISMTVPLLSALADTNTDSVYGAAPISQAVATYLYPFATPELFYTQTAVVDASGQYQAIYSPTLDVRPRDNGYVAYAETPERVVYVRFAAPFLRVQVDNAAISGYAAPRSSIAITVTKADGTPRLQWGAQTDLNGAFEIYAYGNYISPVHSGEHIIASSAGQVFSTAVMSITAHADLATGQITGGTLVSQSIDLLRFNGPLTGGSIMLDTASPIEQLTITSTATGLYTATFTLARPNYGVTIVTSPEGHQTYALWVVPYLAARMGSMPYSGYGVTGQIDEPFAPITITIQGPSGYYKDVRATTAGHTGYFEDWSYALVLDSHDVITVATARGVEMTLNLPLLTGQIDPVSDTVSGQAPPGTRLTLNLSNYLMPPTPPVATPTPHANRSMGGGGPPVYGYTTIVTATAQGNYVVDLHGVLDLGNQSSGEVVMTTADGNTVSRVLGTVGHEDCVAQLQTVNVGSNELGFFDTSKWCSEYIHITIRVRNASGQLKTEQQFTFSPGTFRNLYLYTGGQPVLIMPGDTIEVESHSSPVFVPTPYPTLPPVATSTPYPTPTTAAPGRRTTMPELLMVFTVPTLTVNLDPIANLITGQAPAGAVVSIDIVHDQAARYALTATVDSGGVYTANLDNITTLIAGDFASVTYTPSEPPLFRTTNVLPVLHARLYQTAVDGWLSPLAAYTLTLETQRSVTATRKGTSSIGGSFSQWVPLIFPGDTLAVTTSQTVRRLDMPYLTAHVDISTATVSGQAPPNARLRVEPYPFDRSQIVTATASGVYSASFPDLAPLKTTYGVLTYFDADDDQASLEFAAIHWVVVVGEKCFNGIATVANVPVTLTLRNDAGLVKSTITTTPPTVSWYTACFTTTIQPLDRLTLQTGTATETFYVPMLTALHDFRLHVLKGETPANSEVRATFFCCNSSPVRRTWADANGRYGIDTSDLSLTLNQTGFVRLTDEAGNSTTRYFTITGYRSFLPVMWRK